MDIALGLMMTATALFQEAETPMGEVAFLRPEGDKPQEATGELGQAYLDERENMIASIREDFEMLEDVQRARGIDPEDDLYGALRDIADWQEFGRFEEEQEE